MRCSLLGLVMLAGLARPAVGQESPERRLTFVVRDAPLLETLLRLRQEHGVPLAWRGDLLPRAHRVTAGGTDVALGALLAEVLRDTGLESRTMPSGNILLLPRHEAPADLNSLEQASGIALLDALVVTGSAVDASPGRAQPTAITVAQHADLLESPHRRFVDQVRAFLPGLMLWDRGGAGLPPAVVGVRGVASFTARAPKVYVDGIEVASPELFTLVDGRAVSQLEMIHGPQGAALYGPDALNGVLQVETIRGRPGQDGVTPFGGVEIGVGDRDGASTIPTRGGFAGASFGGGTATGAMLASVTRVGDDAALADAWRLHGGSRISVGGLRVDVSARAARHAAPIERQVASGGPITERAAPPLDEQGLGVRLYHRPGKSFAHATTLGWHHIAGAREPFRSPLLAPRLPLGATNESARRSSARWAGTWSSDRWQLTVGTEAARRTLQRSARRTPTDVDLSALYEEALTSVGGLVQTRAQFGRLTLSGGARADRVSSVGTAAASPWAATAGVSWDAPIGLSTVRLRAAWGKATRPPEPGMSMALVAGTISQVENPTLGAEQQSGLELGAEWHAARGDWLRVTWFDQAAGELIQQVDLRRPVGSTRFYQFMNVGAIENCGLEADGGIRVGRVDVAARVQWVRSAVTALSPTYVGEFSVGDSPLEVPRSSGAVAVRYGRGASRLELGVSWIGGWVGYDWQLVQRVENGSAPGRAGPRDYWLQYPAVVRPFVGATVPLHGSLALTGRFEWPTDRGARLRDNLAPAVMRGLSVALEVAP